MARMMWCADCEEVVQVIDNQFHVVFLGDDSDWAYCYGTFYTSEPEDLLGMWQDELVEPDAEELEVMDQNAEALLFDLGLMEK